MQTSKVINVVRNPQGCQKVAGGRSEAKTTGLGGMYRHPEGVPERKEFLHPFGMPSLFFVHTGGLRFASTTGYFLSVRRTELHAVTSQFDVSSAVFSVMSFWPHSLSRLASPALARLAAFIFWTRSMWVEKYDRLLPTISDTELKPLSTRNFSSPSLSSSIIFTP